MIKMQFPVSSCVLTCTGCGRKKLAAGGPVSGGSCGGLCGRADCAQNQGSGFLVKLRHHRNPHLMRPLRAQPKSLNTTDIKASGQSRLQTARAQELTCGSGSVSTGVCCGGRSAPGSRGGRYEGTPPNCRPRPSMDMIPMDSSSLPRGIDS